VRLCSIRMPPFPLPLPFSRVSSLYSSYSPSSHWDTIYQGFYWGECTTQDGISSLPSWPLECGSGRWNLHVSRSFSQTGLIGPASLTSHYYPWRLQCVT
jgi:hypothetical protein